VKVIESAFSVVHYNIRAAYWTISVACNWHL